MKKQTVLIIASEFPPGPGGIGKHAYDLARALTEKNHLVTVCASQDYSTEEEISQFNRTLPQELSLIRFFRTGLTTQWNRWRIIRKEIKKLQPCMVVVSGRFSLWMGFMITKWYGNKIPVHAFIHGSELRKNNSLHHLLTVQSLKSIPDVWSVSEFTRQLVESETGRSNTRVLPNGLWLNDWDMPEQSWHAPMQEEHPALITVGRVSRRKGQHRVVQAMPTLLHSFPKVHYHIIGIADAKGPVEALASKLGIISKVTFHGRIPTQQSLAGLYNAAEVFIMLSENQPDGEVEGFGIAILEANYFGLPAIGSKGCGISDAIIDGYNGRLVEGSDPGAIRDALKDIMEHFETYSIHAREWAKRHDWNRLVEYFLRNETPAFLNVPPMENNSRYSNKNTH